jgi:hypothetical protein
MPPDANITAPAGAMVLRSWIPAASGLIDVLFDRLGAPLDTSFRSLAARSEAAATPKAAFSSHARAVSRPGDGCDLRKRASSGHNGPVRAAPGGPGSLSRPPFVPTAADDEGPMKR